MWLELWLPWLRSARGSAGRISLRLAKFSSFTAGWAGVESIVSFIVALPLHTRSRNAPKCQRALELYLRRREISPTVPQESLPDNPAEVPLEAYPKSCTANNFPPQRVLVRSPPLRSLPLQVTTATSIATSATVPARTG